MEKTKVGVVIGRFQPLHNGHLKIIKQALKENDKVYVLLGSSYHAPTIKNPFDYKIRSNMIVSCLNKEEQDRTTCFAIRDHMYSDLDWQVQVRRAVEQYPDEEVYIYGGNKDDSTRYLTWFPDWIPVVVPTTHPIHATTFRNLWLENKTLEYHSDIPNRIVDYINKLSPQFKDLFEEYAFIKKYRKQQEAYPYPITIHTVDSVVIHKAHVLLIKRNAMPGRGLWALPGGHIKPEEFLVDAAFRELVEETHICSIDQNNQTQKLRISRDWIKAHRTFDHPERSMRGRVITTAYLWKIPNHIKLDIQADDDADEAQWFPLDVVLGYWGDTNLFEDHREIIEHLIKN